MVSYDAQTTRSIRLTAGGLFTIVFGYLFAGATLSALTLNDLDMPGYPIFWLATFGLTVSSIFLGMGKQRGVRALQLFTVVALVGLVWSNVRHDPLAFGIDVLLFGGASAVAEWIGQLMRQQQP